ncbi:hypothetical protein [Aquabacterium sp.]|uniref:hypothetical protein n=1 Tax=Aquabacterium sp. TaxID=1872578 RepID=UPI0035B3A718
MQFSFLKGALAAASMLVVTSAFAAASSTASLTNLHFQLVDLTPDDGIAPSFQLLSTASYNGYSAPDRISGQVQNNAGPYSTVNYQIVDLTPLGNLSKTESVSGVSVSSAIADTSLMASGTSTQGKTSYSAGASIDANSYYGGGIKLSANSALIITADAWVDASALNVVENTSNYCCYYTNPETASAGVSLSLTGPGVGGSQNSSSSLTASVSGSSNYTYVYDPVYGYYRSVFVSPDGRPLLQTNSGKLGVTFLNTTSSDQIATLTATVSVSGTSVAAVPEASTVVLSSLGLLSAAMVARRRRA